MADMVDVVVVVDIQEVPTNSPLTQNLLEVELISSFKKAPMTFVLNSFNSAWVTIGTRNIPLSMHLDFAALKVKVPGTRQHFLPLKVVVLVQIDALAGFGVVAEFVW